jgi:hypothetical protein
MRGDEIVITPGVPGFRMTTDDSFLKARARFDEVVELLSPASTNCARGPTLALAVSADEAIVEVDAPGKKRCDAGLRRTRGPVGGRRRRPE